MFNEFYRDLVRLKDASRGQLEITFRLHPVFFTTIAKCIYIIKNVKEKAKRVRMVKLMYEMNKKMLKNKTTCLQLTGDIVRVCSEELKYLSESNCITWDCNNKVYFTKSRILKYGGLNNGER